MSKPIIYVDQDDVLADFYKAALCPDTGKIRDDFMFRPNFFLNLEPVAGAKEAIFRLEKMGYDLWILTQPVAGHPECYHNKALWVQKHFPSLYKKLILTQDKGLNVGDYLIDDNLPKWKTKFEKNGGKFIHFEYGGFNGSPLGMRDPELLWKQIIAYFKYEQSKSTK